MRCPFCASEQTLVRDSRPAEDGLAIRRRRQCQVCGGRFSTLERVQLRDFVVVKRDGRRVPFDRDKLIRSVAIACRKRGVDPERIEKLVTGIVRQVETSGEHEITSKALGEMAMNALAAVDEVAYVRFASVYKDFATAADFEAFIGGLNHGPKDGD